MAASWLGLRQRGRWELTGNSVGFLNLKVHLQ